MSESEQPWSCNKSKVLSIVFRPASSWPEMNVSLARRPVNSDLVLIALPKKNAYERMNDIFIFDCLSLFL